MLETAHVVSDEAEASTVGADTRPTKGPNEGPLLRIDPEIFTAQFNRRPFFIEHRLADHPLLSLPRLVELAGKLPPDEVEYNAGKLPVNADPARTPRNGLSPEETIRRIESCGSWLVLKRVEHDPEYRRLLDEVLDEVIVHSEAVVPGMCRRQGFIFVSSPGAVTPYHMDNEYNFLLQIRGSKTVHMWDPMDRLALPETTLETFHADFVHRNLPYRPELEQTAWVLPLPGGRGLHFPVNAPHWVQNGPEPSISFSITFDSPAAQRRVRLYRMNARLRQRGLRPRPPGQSAWDAAKDCAYRAYLAARGAKQA